METQSDSSGGDLDLLRDSGFDINPYAVWRFRKSSDEIYGYSPMADAIVEIFSLNQFGKTRIQYAHKSVSPAKNVPIEMRGRVRNEPDGNNYYDDPKRVIDIIPLGGNYPVSIEETRMIQDSVKDKFRVKFFQAFIGRQGEATREEIIQIKNEQAGLMIAQTDRVYVEGIRRIFDIVSDIEDRRGVFSEEQGMPPIPDEILESGGTINFVLTGPLRQAQRQVTELQPIIEPILVRKPLLRRKADHGDQVEPAVGVLQHLSVLAKAGFSPVAPTLFSPRMRKTVQQEVASCLLQQ